MEQRMEQAVALPAHREPGMSAGVDRRVVALTAPVSPAAEQYRSLHYRLERLRGERPLQVLALTSPLPGEGKTLTALNLALVAARAAPERRVVLVDADLRRGQVAPRLGLRSGSPGLAEVLAGACELEEVVQELASPRLAVVPAGALREDPTPLLAGPRMAPLLARLRELYGAVYVDLPPALLFADAAILGHQVDGVLLVVRARTTPGRAARQAVEQLGGVPLVGCVLNGAEAGAAPYLRGERRQGSH